MKPYENEQDTFSIDELTVENRLDRIQIYRNVDLTRDKAGLEKARQLKKLLDGIVAKLSEEDLPDAVTTETPGTVKNPFV